jgi:hypothetical protein
MAALDATTKVIAAAIVQSSFIVVPRRMILVGLLCVVTAVFPKAVIGLAPLLGNADRLIDSLIPITWSQEELSAVSRISYR